VSHGTQVFALPAWLPPELNTCVTETTVLKGHSLFLTGDAVNRFYFVWTGELAAIRCMPNGAEAVMQAARAGEFFAEASLFTPRYTCEARATSDCLVLGWPVERFRENVFRHPETSLAFSRTLAVNLRRQCSRVERLRMKHADGRILHFLACEVGPDGWVTLGGSVQEWASELGLEPETLYRVLAQLEKAGSIERDKRRFRLAGQSSMGCAHIAGLNS
jgi:CRP-like cAMP-binding protein